MPVPQGPYVRTGPEAGWQHYSPRATENYASLPAAAKIALRSLPPGRSVEAILDEDPPILRLGGGGWVSTPRWGRKSITSWQGVEPTTLSFSALFVARYQGEDDVEAFVDEIESMYAPRGDFNAPRHIKVTGASPGTDREWVMTDLTMKASLRTSDGRRRIQPFDVVLTEFVDPDSVIRPTKRASDASNRSRLYTVKTGDTLASIARHRLGDARRADDIRRANLPSLAGGDRALKPKMVILLPAGKLHRS